MRTTSSGMAAGMLAAALLLADSAIAQTSPGRPVAGNSAVPALPKVVPLSLRDFEGRGNALGCDLAGQTGSFEPVFRVRCNEAADLTTLKTGTALSFVSPVEMSYTYDGLYLCGITSQGLRDRSANLQLTIYFHELEIAESGERFMQRRDTGLNANRRGLDFSIPATAFTPLETDAASNGRRPCVTLRFAEGSQNGDQPRLPGDIWIPQAEANVFIRLPGMLPVGDIGSNQFGDFLLVSQAGLTVAGRRPAEP